MTSRIAITRAAAVLALWLGVGVQPVAAQGVDPQLCSDAQAEVDYLLGEGAFVQAAGLTEGVDLLANNIALRDAVCASVDATPVVSTLFPVSSNDISACLPMSNIDALLGQPARFHPGNDPQHANFTGPNGATLQIERVPSDGAGVYQDRLDAGVAHPGWQLAGIDGLGDQAFAVNRGGDSRSLVVLKGDTAWLLHMDGIAAGRGFPQLGRIARSIMDTCV